MTLRYETVLVPGFPSGSVLPGLFERRESSQGLLLRLLLLLLLVLRQAIRHTTSTKLFYTLRSPPEERRNLKTTLPKGADFSPTSRIVVTGAAASVV